MSVCGNSTIGTLVFTQVFFWRFSGIDLSVCGKSSIGTLVYIRFLFRIVAYPHMRTTIRGGYMAFRIVAFPHWRTTIRGPTSAAHSGGRARLWIPSAGVSGYKLVAKDSTCLMSASNSIPVFVALEADLSAFLYYKLGFSLLVTSM